MIKFWPQIAFGIAMLALGAVALTFPHAIIGFAERVLQSKAPFAKWIEPSHVVLSIRSGGVIGILMGLFVLWATWKQ
jgi:hypothetical protein